MKRVIAVQEEPSLACEFYQREVSRIECGHHGDFPLCEPIQVVQDCMSKNVSYRVKVNECTDFDNK